ncbi:tyrosine-type recombinase/integrase [Ponticaulis profundi]|uniref:Tyrosine-type recombinase/integrase n=1 Tax=Ponticaulis profundi TaxID=2665222 RepID=A0ABW1S9K6_9PROT
MYRYKNSAAYQNIAASTRRNWNAHFDLILPRFGACTFAQIERRGFRSEVREYRDTMADTPRKADMFIQVFSRLLSWAVDEEHIARNPITSMGKLTAPRQHAEEIWMPHEVSRFLGDDKISQHIKNAFELLFLTGLRPVDAVSLMWNEVKSDRVVKPTSKSKFQISAVIPRAERLNMLIDRIPRDSVYVLTTAKGTPWSGTDALSQAIQKHAKRLKIDRRTYDLRGSAVTYAMARGMSVYDIAKQMAWSVSEVEKIIDTYCDAETVLNVRTMF